MTKKTNQARLIDQVVAESIKQTEARIAESMGGPPTAETDERLNQDELDRPLSDTDIFTLGQKQYVDKGDWVNYQFYKEGKMLTTKEHPYSWEALQKEFGGGHYTVKMRSIARGVFLKQETQTLA